MIIKGNFYTAYKRKDGFGSQIQYYIWNILYTEINEGKFIMPIIDSMEHNYDNDPEYINKVRKFINLENIYSGYEALINKSTIEFLDMRKAYYFIEYNMDKCLESESLKKIKKAFWSNKDISKIYDTNDELTNYYNIAVHIRRQNKADGVWFKKDANIPIEYYKKKIYEACEKYLFTFGLNKKKPIRIFIYSQGNIDELDCLKENEYGEVIFKLDENMFQTFLGMAAADALILSASSFSYIAAFLSNGEIYYYPFWHRPSKKWNIAKDVPFIDIPGGYDLWLNNLRD